MASVFYDDFSEKRLRPYGLTIHDIAVILEDQEFCCAICGDDYSEDPGKLHIDHDHDNPTVFSVRGLLCHACNMGLGQFRDSPQNLRRAARYIEDRPAWRDNLR